MLFDFFCLLIVSIQKVSRGVPGKKEYLSDYRILLIRILLIYKQIWTCKSWTFNWMLCSTRSVSGKCQQQKPQQQPEAFDEVVDGKKSFFCFPLLPYVFFTGIKKTAPTGRRDFFILWGLRCIPDLKILKKNRVFGTLKRFRCSITVGFLFTKWK